MKLIDQAISWAECDRDRCEPSLRGSTRSALSVREAHALAAAVLESRAYISRLRSERAADRQDADRLREGLDKIARLADEEAQRLAFGQERRALEDVRNLALAARTPALPEPQ